LVGANSAGKTTVLEAVADLLSGNGELRTDPGDRSDPWVGGSVTFDLSLTASPGSEDQLIFRDLLVGRYGPGPGADTPVPPFSALDPDVAELLAGSPLQDVTDYLISALVSAGTAGTPEDRRCLAKAVFLDPLFVTDFRYVVLCVELRRLDEGARGSALRIADVEGSDPDWLRSLAKSLASGRLGYVATVSDQARPLLQNWVRVVKLDTDPERLASEVEAALPILHNRLWQLEEPPGTSDDDSKAPWELADRVVDEFLITSPGTDTNYLDPDPWVESLVDTPDGEQIVTGTLFGPYDAGDWHRVRRSLLAVAEIVSSASNEFAPAFVQEYGQINVEVLPMTVWAPNHNRVRVTVQENKGESPPRSLRVVGSGIARWVAASVRLACQRLQTAERTVADPAGRLLVTSDERNAVISTARDDPLGQDAVRLLPSPSTSTVYLVDEPESHLHPFALRSVAHWLHALADTSAAVLVATHHPAILDTRPRLARVVTVERDADVANLVVREGGAMSTLSAINDQFGLSPGELLLLTQLLLLVEGEHDKVVLEEWFGNELSDAGVRIVPLRGIKNLVGLPQTEIVQALGVRIAALSDEVDIRAVRENRARTTGERAMVDFLRQAQTYGLDVKPVGLSRPDILYYLDVDVCRGSAPRFPGFEQARREFDKVKAPGQSWKKWITATYGLRTDIEGVRELARQSRTKVPREIRDIMKGILGLATS
jgi:hypothetical protein